MNASNQNDKIIDTGDIEPPKGWKASWEVKTLLFILRAMAVLVFVGYVLYTAPMAYSWIQMKWVRAQPLEQALPTAEAYIKDGHPEKIADWVLSRPVSERKQLMEILEPLTGELPSGLFIAYASWEHNLGNAEQSLFWYQYARYRLRYDALRCGIPSGTDDMTGLLDLMPRDSVQKTMTENPKLLPVMIERVLKYDAKYPANNNPADICSKLNTLNNTSFVMLPQERWADNRYILRMATEAALKRMKADKKK